MDAIATSGLTKRFGATTAVDDLDLVAGAGEVFGFLGPATTCRNLARLRGGVPR